MKERPYVDRDENRREVHTRSNAIPGISMPEEA